VRFPDPNGTRQPCPNGCGQITVLAEHEGTGRTERVHAGTWETRCHPVHNRPPRSTT
jgi:ribosomal protein S27AE